MRTGRRDRRGISYIEMIVAIAIFSTGAYFILSLLPEIRHGFGVNQRYRNAVEIVSNQLELLYLTDLTAFDGQGEFPLMEDAGDLESLPDARGMYLVEREEAGYQVHIRLEWNEGKSVSRYALQTILSDRIVP